MGKRFVIETEESIDGVEWALTRLLSQTPPPDSASNPNKFRTLVFNFT